MKRSENLGNARRIVVKIGSSVLRDGGDFDRVTFASIARDISVLRKKEIEVVIVCSGAVALGMSQLGLTARPKRIERLQAAAAVGQGRLMRWWTDELSQYQQIAAQVLLTHDDLSNRTRFLAARHTLRDLLELGAIPIINENDTVAIDEIKLGDNDLLSSQVVGLTEASMLILMSDVDGFFDGDPQSQSAQRIPSVHGITTEMLKVAGGSQSGLGSGGMRTKLEAVRQVNQLGVPAAIVRGKDPGVLARLYRGEDVGTWFTSQSTTLKYRKHWIAYAPRIVGDIHIDPGAMSAIVHKGKSLLPIGVTSVQGSFSIGDAVRIKGPDGQEIARGLVGFDSETLRSIAGKRSDDFVKNAFDHPEVIHRDDLVVMDNGN